MTPKARDDVSGQTEPKKSTVGSGALGCNICNAFVLLGLSGGLLGSMGMDVHWTSKEAPYIAATCVALLVCVCLAAGLKLRKRTKT
jgi:hypothetical protein